MDEKTQELRDIFMDVAEDETVTERQEESPGSLADEGSAEERLREVLSDMRDRYTFRSDLEDETLLAIIHGFYEGNSDDALAEELGVTARDVFHARMDLHLLKETDRDAPCDFDELRRAAADGDRSAAELLGDVDPDPYLDVLEAEEAMRRANYRFRDQFDDILGDGDLEEHLTRNVTDDGLEDATEGMEIDTGF